MPPLEFIKISKDEYDRLVELSPFMPLSVITEFNKKFKKNSELCKPEICDELSSTDVYSIDNNERIMLMNEALNIKKPRLSADQIKRKTIIKKQVDEKTRRFKETFHSLNGRDPTQEEINKNIKKYINGATQDDSLMDIAFDPINSQINETVVNEVLSDVAGRTEDTLNNSLEVVEDGMNIVNNIANTVETMVNIADNLENLQENDETTGNNSGGVNDDTDVVSIV